MAQIFAKNQVIYWTPRQGAFHVNFNGAIGSKYRAAGYEHGYGYPTMAEIAINGGVVQRFARVDGRTTAVYWDAVTHRTHAVWEAGSIGHRYNVGGGPGRYGLPTMDETVVLGSVQQKFRTAAGAETLMVWSPTTGTKVLNARGGLYWYWVNNGYIGQLGYPTSDEVAQADGSVVLNFTSGAQLRWSPGAGVQRVR